MKLALTDEEKSKAEIAAVQRLLQKKFQEAIEARVEQMEAEIGDVEITAEELMKKYLPSSDLAIPRKKGLLVPA